jgi:hypothetical protein
MKVCVLIVTKLSVISPTLFDHEFLIPIASPLLLVLNSTINAIVKEDEKETDSKIFSNISLYTKKLNDRNIASEGIYYCFY